MCRVASAQNKENMRNINFLAIFRVTPNVLTHLPLAAGELASPAHNVHHLGQLVRGAVLGATALMPVVGLSRAASMLASTILDVNHAFLLMGGAKFGPLPIHAVSRLPGALVVLTSV